MVGAEHAKGQQELSSQNDHHTHHRRAMLHQHIQSLRSRLHLGSVGKVASASALSAHEHPETANVDRASEADLDREQATLGAHRSIILGQVHLPLALVGGEPLGCRERRRGPRSAPQVRSHRWIKKSDHAREYAIARPSYATAAPSNTPCQEIGPDRSALRAGPPSTVVRLRVALLQLPSPIDTLLLPVYTTHHLLVKELPQLTVQARRRLFKVPAEPSSKVSFDVRRRAVDNFARHSQ